MIYLRCGSGSEEEGTTIEFFLGIESPRYVSAIGQTLSGEISTSPLAFLFPPIAFLVTLNNYLNPVCEMILTRAVQIR